MHRIPIFELILTAALAVAAMAAQTCALQADVARHRLDGRCLSLSDKLGDFRRHPEKGDLSEISLLRRCYIKGDRMFVVYARQSASLDQIHDFHDCLLSNGFEPVDRGTVLVSEDTKPRFEASLISLQAEEKELSMLWFQSGSITGANRWAWRKELLLNGWVQNPIYREYRVTTNDTGDFKKDLSALSAFALAIRRLNF